MTNAASQDTQWLMCLTEALGLDDLEIYFENQTHAAAVITMTEGDIELVSYIGGDKK